MKSDGLPQLDKTVKYDRQLRLWAASGQLALEKARIALIGGCAVGTETLKNLVLPGIGSYTIIDDQLVKEGDTGNNFFVDVESIGRSRAAVTCAFLQELNSDVHGKWDARGAATIIAQDHEHFSRDFDLVIVATLDHASLLTLSDHLWKASIPLIVVKSVGFMGYLRLALPEHDIIESHPDSIVDLRLDVPWQELSETITDLSLEAMNDNEHTHVPYVLLLLHYLHIWKQKHNGKSPSTFAEKNEFKDLIRSGKRNIDEDNFDEAVSNVWRACSTTTIPSDVQQILNEALSCPSSAGLPNFWLLARALAKFVRSSGSLPLAGTVPDMKSDTGRYIDLQRVYRNKAQSDIDAVYANLEGEVSREEVESFCKHAAFIKVMRYRSLRKEMENPRIDEIVRNDDGGLSYQFLAIRAYELFKSRNTRDPATQDIPLLKELVKDTWPSFSEQNMNNALIELIRCPGELHNIASFMGGVAAQEIIKVITKQYVLCNNTVIFDGIKSTTSVYEL